jgi:ubiquinone/menaquinone biosynthesis C-methylase UbiE
VTDIPPMTEPETDIWAQWLLHRRHGGDVQRLKAMLEYLYPIRNRVLKHAMLSERGTLLDVGCGDGLIGFGALEALPSSRVIFSDISQDLLGQASSVAQQTHLADRCEFLCASADDLSAVPPGSVDAVTTRSVLIYVEGKQRAFDEFYRVLKRGGRLSIFEPINRFGEPQPPHLFWGWDVAPIMEIAGKVKAVYRHLQPLDTDPMMNFDERDLIVYAEKSGFEKIHLELEAEVTPVKEMPGPQVSWEAFMRLAANPRIPTLEEACAQALTVDEAATFAAHMRPLVEARAGTARSAVAYLWARK